jgi:dTMP kinase
MRAHQVTDAEPVERADDLDPHVARQAKGLAPVPGAVHDDAAHVVRPLRVPDLPDRVPLRAHPRRGLVGGPGHAVAVQHHHRRLEAREPRDGRADLGTLLHRRGGYSERAVAGGVVHPFGERFADHNGPRDEDDQKLYGGDRARDEGGGAPGADEGFGSGGVVHGRRLFSPGDRTILPRVFVTFEGLDGSGKSTQAERLREWLEQAGGQVVATREPGGTALGERVRDLLLNGEPIAPWSEAALFAAARAELVERVIAPALAEGAEVISDRYLDSSLAYQGVARGLGIDRVLALNLDAIRGILPDLTVLLLVDVEVARKRSPTARDRIEREGDAFLELVDKGFREVAARFPQRIVSIEGDRPVDDVAEEIRDHVRERSGTG